VAAPGLGAEPIRVLELGCGQGLSANIIAAANPHIDYTAIDFNPEHIAGAQALAKDAGAPNVRFIEASFEQIAEDTSFTPFDVITLHGIYTWVSAENRAHIIRVARDKLKTGGLLYVSYNCYPGWSPVIPIRCIFTDTSEVSPKEPIFDRLAEGLRLFDRLKDIKARYIGATPGLVERMEQVKKLQRNYVAHEYLNGEWTIFHSPEVAADMARAKLSYGSAHLLDHVDGINLTAEQSQFLAEIKDSTRREYFRDLIVNQQFRRDIFVKGTQRLGFLTARDKWLDLRLVLSVPAADLPKTVKGALGEAKLQDEVYEPIVAKLDGQPKTVRELLANPSIANLQLQQALIVLLGQGKCHIALPSSGESGDAGCCRPDAAQFVWDVLKSHVQKLIKEGKTVESARNRRKVSSRTWGGFVNPEGAIKRGKLNDACTSSLLGDRISLASPRVRAIGRAIGFVFGRRPECGPEGHVSR